jgi:hypothetical protein
MRTVAAIGVAAFDAPSPAFYIPPMLRSALLILPIFLLAACQSDPTQPLPTQTETLFGPASMRMHPIFTQLKDWSGGGKPDGIEAVVEFSDRFGDTTKAAGTLLFELFTYREAFPDHRGNRVVQPWIGDIETVDEQQAHWDRASRAYTFQLAWPDIRVSKSYVLTATFEPVGGVDNNGQKRLFDELVLPAVPTEKTRSETAKLSDLFKPSTEPTTEPLAEPATEPSVDQPLSAPPLPPDLTLPQLPPATPEPTTAPSTVPSASDSTTAPDLTTAPAMVSPTPDATTAPATSPTAPDDSPAAPASPDAAVPTTVPMTAPSTQP